MGHCMHGEFELWVIACMVSFSCGSLHAWGVLVVGHCMHGEF